jgi:hypothetical protein
MHIRACQRDNCREFPIVSERVLPRRSSGAELHLAVLKGRVLICSGKMGIKMERAMGIEPKALQ